MNHARASVFVLALSGLFVACSDDDPVIVENGGRLNIAAQATYAPLTGDRSNIQSPSSVELSKFLVNFSEIELEFEDVIDGDRMYTSSNDIELRGPFEVNLLQPSPLTLVNLEVPNGRLNEIEFEFDKSENSGSELYKQSMRIEGTIDNVPFVFWHDFEEEIELEFDGGPNPVIADDQNSIVINFDLTPVFDTSTIDLSIASDGNGDGVIEISPNDPDGNRVLAEAIKTAIKNQIEVYEELHD